ncbi:hypothetical protein P4S63_16010 [Pseudoalteromonas sp. B193]
MQRLHHAVFTSPTQSYLLAKNQITIEDDIYVDIQSLHNALNLEFNIDYPDLELLISSEIPYRLNNKDTDSRAT